MEPKNKQTTEKFIKDIRRRNRRVFSSEQKIMIAMEAQRGEESVASICRKHAKSSISGLVPGIYVFNLTVTDNLGLSASALITITVNVATSIYQIQMEILI